MKTNQNTQRPIRICSAGYALRISPMTVALALIATGAGLVGTSGFAASKAVVDTSASPNVKFRPPTKAAGPI